MVMFRLLLPAEHWRYTAHLLRLSAQDRRARFLTAMDDQALRDYVRRIDWNRALVLAAIVDGEIRGVGELRRDQTIGGTAEMAFSIEAGQQGLGLGKQLMARLKLLARNRQVRRLYLMCAADNRRMITIARRNLGPVSFDCGEVTCELELPPPTPFTLAEEMLDRGSQMLAWLPMALAA